MKRILVIEDDFIVRGFLKEFLTAKGYEVVVANDGQDGFRKATTQDFEFIIMDMRMPNWNGLDAVNGITMVKKNTKFIVITGYADITISEKIKDYPQVKAILKKPIDTEILLSYLDGG